MGLRKLCGITKDTRAGDRALRIYDKMNDAIKKVSDWAVDASCFLEFCINDPAGRLLKKLSKNEPNFVKLFNMLRSNCV